MTELLIVSKPRGKIFKWIGGGVYKEYQNPVSMSKSDSVSDLTISGTDIVEAPLYSGAETRRAQQYVIPNKQNLAIRRVSIWLRRVGSPTGTLYVELWDDDGDLPNSKIADIGSRDVSTISTSGDSYSFTPSQTITLDPDTKYWVVVRYEGGDSSNYIKVRKVGDVKSWYSAYYDSSWHREVWDYDFDLYLKFVNLTLQINLDFIYSGTAIKRLQESISKTNVSITDAKVNGLSVGTSLTKEDEIKQADNYTVVYYFDSTANSYSLNVSIQRYLYYAKTSITLDDLDVSEAYLQEVEYGGDGGILRIDDSPDSDLVGSANETIQFTDILVPFRKLEWISGGGEVLILGVE